MTSISYRRKSDNMKTASEQVRVDLLFWFSRYKKYREKVLVTGIELRSMPCLLGTTL